MFKSYDPNIREREIPISNRMPIYPSTKGRINCFKMQQNSSTYKKTNQCSKEISILNEKKIACTGGDLKPMGKHYILHKNSII